MSEACVAVLDVGKTHSKLSLWRRTGELLARRSRANERVQAQGYLALDHSGIEHWLAQSLAEFASLYSISHIVPVAHGAAAAVIRDGHLVCAPVDYEQTIPMEVAARYEPLRGGFAETGSPRLPDGLNLGAQLHWLETLTPGIFDGDAQILTWPQYWAWLLSGVAACEVTTLGCHSDLWNPSASQFSSLAVSRGWARKFAPLRRADQTLGSIRPEWAVRCGLSPSTVVMCGLHDSNAALLAARGFSDLADRELTLISTGTWFLAMRTLAAGSGGLPLGFSEQRDCLINVDAFGSTTPTARFMGGREIELLLGGSLNARRREDAARDQVEQIVNSGIQVLPSVTAGVGPFPRAQHRWENEPQEAALRQSAVELYAALVADTTLELVGARENVLIEGRFAEAEVFVRSIATLRRNACVYVSSAHDQLPFGALRLLDPDLKPSAVLRRIEPLPIDLTHYQKSWRGEAERLEKRA